MVPRENSWHAKIGPFKESLIKERFTKMWAEYRETTRDDVEPGVNNCEVPLPPIAWEAKKRE